MSQIGFFRIENQKIVSKDKNKKNSSKGRNSYIRITTTLDKIEGKKMKVWLLCIALFCLKKVGKSSFKVESFGRKSQIGK